MSYSAIWMDHQRALMFTFTKEKGTIDKMAISEEIIIADTPVEHNNRHPNDVNSDVKELRLSSYFHKIISKLENVDQLMLMGPGITKSQFQHHCEEHSHKKISKAIVGLETMESHAKKVEMIEKAQTFYETYNQKNA